jgi:hypothetical protein
MRKVVSAATSSHAPENNMKVDLFIESNDDPKEIIIISLV